MVTRWNLFYLDESLYSVTYWTVFLSMKLWTRAGYSCSPELSSASTTRALLLHCVIRKQTIKILQPIFSLLNRVISFCQ